MTKEEAAAFMKGFIQRDLLSNVTGVPITEDFTKAREIIGEDTYFEILDEQALYFKANHI